MKRVFFFFFPKEMRPLQRKLSQICEVCCALDHECHISIRTYLPSNTWESKNTCQNVRRSWINSFFFLRTNWDKNHYDVLLTSQEYMWEERAKEYGGYAGLSPIPKLPPITSDLGKDGEGLVEVSCAGIISSYWKSNRNTPPFLFPTLPPPAPHPSLSIEFNKISYSERNKLWSY